MSQQIQLRNDSTANWTTENPVLAQGEIGIDTTTNEFKIGDGESTWSELEYFTNGGGMTLPASIKDTNGNDLIVFEKGNTGVARIHAVQDDLALRSARDIILYPGDDGPGNVYINWGDATISPNATNRVATIADIQDANIADFVFTSEEGQSSISLPGDKQMRIQAGADSDLYLTAGDDLYIQTLGEGDDIHLNAADDIRFTTNNEDSANEPVHEWRMDSEGLLQLPGDGYISNPYAETYSVGTYTVSYSDNYLNDQSGLNQTTGVYLPVEQSTLWFIGNNTFTSPVTITFADSTTVQTVAIYNATNQGTPAVVFQWNNQISKTYANTFPLSISVQYEQVSYGASTIVLDPQWIGNDQKVVIDATGGQPGHIHVRAGGTIDESTADLILGGERNKVKISDTDRSVVVSTRATRVQNTYQNANQESNANLVAVMPVNIDEGATVNVNGTEHLVTGVLLNTPDTGLATITATGASFVAGTYYTFTYEPNYDNGWTFDSNGYLSGPAMGGLLVSGIYNGVNNLWLGSDNDVNIQSGNDHDIYLSPGSGGKIFLEPASNHVYVGIESPGNRVAQVEDLAYTRVAVPASSIGVEGHRLDMIADDANYHYYCTGTYDGTTNIWKRVAWSVDTWGV